MPISRRPQVYVGWNWAVITIDCGAVVVEGEALWERKAETRDSWNLAAWM